MDLRRTRGFTPNDHTGLAPYTKKRVGEQSGVVALGRQAR